MGLAPNPRGRHWQQEGQTQTSSLPLGRQTICITTPPISDNTGNIILHNGDEGFQDRISNFYTPLETEAIESLVHLKARLRQLTGDNFWCESTEGLAQLLGAQYSFISKRMFEDPDDPTSQLPLIGEVNSCLLGLSVYYAGGGNSDNSKKSEKLDSFNALKAKYFGYNCPCAHMKHNKTVLIPENLSDLIPNNPNILPEKPQGYLAVPLSYFSQRTNSTVTFGHFGVMWTADGLKKRQLPFSILESLMYGVQDIICNQFIEQNLLDDESGQRQILIPAASVTPTTPTTTTPLGNASSNMIQTKPPPVSNQMFSPDLIFRPFARSLSHELRTPMQGVVGMLDVMFAQVQTTAESGLDARLLDIFANLKESIEVVQDSARRAVEAADNIVHAYDMNMSIPDAQEKETNEIFAPGLESLAQLTDPPHKQHPNPHYPEYPNHYPQHSQHSQHSRSILPPTPSDSVSPQRGHKRSTPSIDNLLEHPSKYRKAEVSDDIVKRTPFSSIDSSHSGHSSTHNTSFPQSTVERQIAPGIRQTNVRQTLQEIINDILNIGRPSSKIASPIDDGEEIEVRRLGPSPEFDSIQNVQWTVHSLVPENIVIDERDFVGLIYRVFHNAVKFTEAGNITISARMSRESQYIVISVADSGPGIPTSFMSKLFRPFSKEDNSLTRSSEGLGLGLMVAKGLARKLHGDLIVTRSETEGPRRGTEFTLRIPVVAGDNSHPGTPFTSPSPANFPATHGDDKARSSPLRHERATSTPDPAEVAVVMPPPSAPSTTSSSGSYFQQLKSNATFVPHILRLNETTKSDEPFAKLAERLPRSFLIVEDNPVLRRILTRMLKDFGYTHILEAFDGAQAVKQVEKHQDKLKRGEVSYDIDVVLMDLWMPVMNGYEAAEKILALYDRNPPTIMAITADVTDEATEKVVSAGMKGPLNKPYKMRDLERNLLDFC